MFFLIRIFTKPLIVHFQIRDTMMPNSDPGLKPRVKTPARNNSSKEPSFVSGSRKRADAIEDKISEVL